MHDAVSGERLGIPSAAIMTNRFVSAAELMSRTLGADGYPFVTIDHPISSAGPDQLAAAGRAAAGECVALLTTTG
ncbi:MAG: hypothetical protein OER95_18445 [Acidimicrobiia bacterium]|nr:hypothetical protein [Acidimicrobiia bacterium]